MEGTIVSWNKKGYGFIRYENRKEIFFSISDVAVADWKGSKSWCFVENTPCSFSITTRGKKQRAIDIRPMFPLEDAPEDLRGYREISILEKKSIDWGFLRRPCGDSLFIHVTRLVEGHNPRWSGLRTSDYVYHGVAYRDGKWQADNVELYSEAEQEAMRQPADPEPVKAEPAPEPEPQSEIFKPENRNKTIAQLVAERRKKNGPVVIDCGKFD